ncbi:MAG TPA: glycerol-3-phosphate 1-O-acyltransferase PlsY [Pyrinomonadaceae bacterium]
MSILISILVSYLLGSIPFGYLIVTVTTGNDIRETGSGGTGATNVSRRAGKSAGILTLVLDALKGAFAILMAERLMLDVDHAAWWIGLAGVTAMIGHIFPCWLKFRGGKGVATGVGVFLMIAPYAILLSGLIFIIAVWTTRYVSLGSILAALSIPVIVLIWPERPLWSTFATALAGALLIIYAHRGNIGRLVSGTESKFR